MTETSDDSSRTSLGEPLLLGEIRFGMRDARNEVARADQLESFLASYQEPEQLGIPVYIADYLNGTKYFVYGRKGTGKTALLHYIAKRKIGDSSATRSRFVYFNSQVSNAERERLFALDAAQNNTPVVEADKADIAAAWRVYLHREIGLLLSSNRESIATLDELDDYCREARLFFDEETGSGLLQRFFDRLKEGEISIPTGIGPSIVLRWPRNSVMVSELAGRLDKM